MDTRRYLLIKNLANFNEGISFPEVDGELSAQLQKFVQFAEDFEGLYQLYQVFLCNIEFLTERYNVFYGDYITDKRDNSNVDFIEINTMLINIVSAGKTLIEAIENFLKNNTNDEMANKFKADYISKKYDDVFSYRFLYYLRNYSQHGNLIVSQQADGRVCFDLAQILSSHHLYASKSIKESMENVYEELVSLNSGDPYIAFTYTLDTYTLSVVELYYQFLVYIGDYLADIYHEKCDLVDKHPEIVLDDGEHIKDVVVFGYTGNNVHVFLNTDSLNNRYIDIKNDVREKLKYFKKEHLEI